MASLQAKSEGSAQKAKYNREVVKQARQDQDNRDQHAALEDQTILPDFKPRIILPTSKPMLCDGGSSSAASSSDGNAGGMTLVKSRCKYSETCKCCGPAGVGRGLPTARLTPNLCMSTHSNISNSISEGGAMQEIVGSSMAIACNRSGNDKPHALATKFMGKFLYVNGPVENAADKVNNAINATATPIPGSEEAVFPKDVDYSWPCGRMCSEVGKTCPGDWHMYHGLLQAFSDTCLRIASPSFLYSSDVLRVFEILVDDGHKVVCFFSLHWEMRKSGQFNPEPVFTECDCDRDLVGPFEYVGVRLGMLVEERIQPQLAATTQNPAPQGFQIVGRLVQHMHEGVASMLVTSVSKARPRPTGPTFRSIVIKRVLYNDIQLNDVSLAGVDTSFEPLVILADPKKRKCPDDPKPVPKPEDMDLVDQLLRKPSAEPSGTSSGKAKAKVAAGKPKAKGKAKAKGTAKAKADKPDACTILKDMRYLTSKGGGECTMGPMIAALLTPEELMGIVGIGETLHEAAEVAHEEKAENGELGECEDEQIAYEMDGKPAVSAEFGNLADLCEKCGIEEKYDLAFYDVATASRLGHITTVGENLRCQCSRHENCRTWFTLHSAEKYELGVLDFVAWLSSGRMCTDEEHCGRDST